MSEVLRIGEPGLFWFYWVLLGLTGLDWLGPAGQAGGVPVVSRLEPTNETVAARRKPEACATAGKETGLHGKTVAPRRRFVTRRQADFRCGHGLDERL
jgi:hypothetical protein